MKEITLFLLNNCPHCKLALRLQEELLEEHPAWRDIPLRMVDEAAEPAYADTFDYYYVPCYYVDGVKVHEGHAEREDVEKLERGGLRALLLSLTGDREARLSQERREELAARLQYDQARRDAEDLEERIRDLLQEREELRAVRTRLEALLGEKAERLKELGGTGGTRLAELDRALDALAAQRREVGEALHAGRQAEQALSGVLDSLDSAESWGTWDMLGGGLFTTMAKHGHIDDARAGIDHAQRALSRFRTELADVRDMELPQVQIGEFATFADYFFDGFFMDWMVQSKIQDAQEGVSEVHVRVLNALRNLERMDQELAEEQDGLKREREGLLLRSSGSD